MARIEHAPSAPPAAGPASPSASATERRRLIPLMRAAEHQGANGRVGEGDVDEVDVGCYVGLEQREHAGRRVGTPRESAIPGPRVDDVALNGRHGADLLGRSRRFSSWENFPMAHGNLQARTLFAVIPEVLSSVRKSGVECA